MSIKDEIRKAFPLGPKPAQSLSDSIAEDNWGKRYDIQETWADWTEITNEQVEQVPHIFIYLDNASIAYFLPRYMTFALDEASGFVQSDSGSGDSTIHWLLHMKHTDGLRSLFSDAQHKVIDAFLDEVAESDEFEDCFQGPNPHCKRARTMSDVLHVVAVTVFIVGAIGALGASRWVLGSAFLGLAVATGGHGVWRWYSKHSVSQEACGNGPSD